VPHLSSRNGLQCLLLGLWGEAGIIKVCPALFLRHPRRGFPWLPLIVVSLVEGDVLLLVLIMDILLLIRVTGVIKLLNFCSGGLEGVLLEMRPVIILRGLLVLQKQ